MFTPPQKSPERLHAAARVKDWTRSRFGLPPEATISVSQLACSLPGCAPLETVVVFWIAERRHHFKIFKPLEGVSPEDLPPAWLRDALAVADGLDYGCC